MIFLSFLFQYLFVAKIPKHNCSLHDCAKRNTSLGNNHDYRPNNTYISSFNGCYFGCIVLWLLNFIICWFTASCKTLMCCCHRCTTFLRIFYCFGLIEKYNTQLCFVYAALPGGPSHDTHQAVDSPHVRHFAPLVNYDWRYHQSCYISKGENY